jgi:DNA-binding IclR family transcriptional regulator
VKTPQQADDARPGPVADVEESGPKDAAGGVAAVERALSIIAAFVGSTWPLGLADISRITGLYKSTVLRLLVSLEKNTYVVRLPDGRYSLGAMAFRLGHAYEQRSGLQAHLLPILEDLVAQGCESPSFHIWHSAEQRLCLMRVDSHHSTLDRVRAGDLLPLRLGAAGRVLVANTPPGPPEGNLVIPAFGERDPACAGVACPVFGPGGSLVGALSLSGPMERFTPSAVTAMSRQILRAAIAGTDALGGDTLALRKEYETKTTFPPQRKTRANRA